MDEWSLVLGVISAIAALAALWLTVRHRRRDRAASISATVEKLVRECESRRVLWNPFSSEEPAASYQSVQALRQAIRAARGALPAQSKGIDELDQMKKAAELFCSRYETLDRRRARFRRRVPVDTQSLEALIGELRAEFVPALERLRELHSISVGHRPSTENPFIGEPLRAHYVSPPDER